MPIELRVPEVGESISEVQIGDWLKKVGDLVERDEPLVAIETDKVTVDLLAPQRGRLSQILLQKGATAKVKDVVGWLEEVTSSTSAAQTQKTESEIGTEAAGTTAAQAELPPYRDKLPTENAIPSTRGSAPAAQTASSVAVNAAPPPVATAARPPAAVEPGNWASPSARRHRAEIQARSAQPQSPAVGSDRERVAGGSSETVQLPSAGTQQPAHASAALNSREEDVVAMTPFRRTIAERLVQSKNSAALLTTFNEVDLSTVQELRRTYQDAFQKRYQIKLGLMSFFVRAVVEALKQIPVLNAELRGNEIVYKNYYDIGVAVGGGRGLVVPVIRNAEFLGLAEIERAIAEYSVRAKDNKLQLSELTGGTFTISNGGVYGSMLSTPIINPPQSGILGLHAIQDRPVAHQGQVVIRPMMYIALTYDHRIVDGREAVTFLRLVKEFVEQPARILLEV